MTSLIRALSDPISIQEGFDEVERLEQPCTAYQYYGESTGQCRCWAERQTAGTAQ